jgi:hypothetical protein
MQGFTVKWYVRQVGKYLWTQSFKCKHRCSTQKFRLGILPYLAITSVINLDWKDWLSSKGLLSD